MVTLVSMQTLVLGAEFVHGWVAHALWSVMHGTINKNFFFSNTLLELYYSLLEIIKCLQNIINNLRIRKSKYWYVKKSKLMVKIKMVHFHSKGA